MIFETRKPLLLRRSHSSNRLTINHFDNAKATSNRRRKETQKKLLESQQKQELEQLKEKAERSRAKGRDKKRKWRANRKARTAIMSSPSAEPPSTPAPGVQSPPFTPLHNYLAGTPIRGLTPIQFLSNEAMHRRTAFGGNVCEAAKETSNSVITARFECFGRSSANLPSEYVELLAISNGSIE